MRRLTDGYYGIVRCNYGVSYDNAKPSTLFIFMTRVVMSSMKGTRQCGYNLFQKLHSIYFGDSESMYLIADRGLCMYFGGTVSLAYFTIYCFKQGYTLAQQGTRH